MKILLCSLLFTTSLWAAVLEVNSQHSRIGFAVDYMEVSSVEGQFTEYRGQMEFQAKNADLVSADFALNTSSIFTGDNKRDNHLKGKDFFDAKNFPEILVHVDHVFLPIGKAVQVPVEITIKNITLKRMFTIINKGEKKDPWGKASQFFSLEGKINRQDFNLNWNRSIDRGGLLVGNIVHIKAQFEWQETGKKTPFSRYYVPVTDSIDQMAKAQRGEIAKAHIPSADTPQTNALKTSDASTEVLSIKQTTEDKIDGLNIGYRFIMGFLGFIVACLISIGIKVKLLKNIKESEKGKTILWEVIGDSVVLAVVFLYSVVFFKFLYP